MKRYIRNYTFILLAIFTGWLAAGCSSNFMEGQLNTSEDYELIYNYIETRADLSIYKDLCEYTGFVGTISTGGTYTVFVPTDTAFQDLFTDLGISSYREKEKEYWLNYLKYHTLTVTKNTSAFNNGLMEESTLLGKEFKLTVDISKYPYLIFNNSSQITEPNIKKQNGNINIMNHVIVPPISSVRDLLVKNGGYTRMVALFDEYGLSSYLNDSLVTVMVEPDFVIERGLVDLDTISDMEGWLKYHIIPNERSFTTNLDGRFIKTLYKGDGITFNNLKRGEITKMYCNQRFPFCNRENFEPDQLALNGVLQPLDSVLRIITHTAGNLRINLYGNDNAKRRYQKNVFADSPAAVREDYNIGSFHQGKMVPCCKFEPSQVGDECRLVIPDVVPGSYTVRLLYYTLNAPTITLLRDNAIIKSDIRLNEKDGDFAEWQTLQYKDCGVIDITEKGDINLRIKISGTTASTLYMDMIELIPSVK